MRFLLWFHLAVTLAICGALYLSDKPAEAVSLLAGSALTLTNIAVLYFCWKRILAKKSIAMSVGVIVIKYATLGFIIYRVATSELFMKGWFMTGFGLILITAVATAVFVSRSENADDNQTANEN